MLNFVVTAVLGCLVGFSLVYFYRFLRRAFTIWRILHTGVMTNARIVQIKERSYKLNPSRKDDGSRGPDSAKAWREIVHLRTAAGRDVRTSLPEVRQALRVRRVGDIVRVLYDPDMPTMAIRDDASPDIDEQLRPVTILALSMAIAGFMIGKIFLGDAVTGLFAVALPALVVTIRAGRDAGLLALAQKGRLNAPRDTSHDTLSADTPFWLADDEYCPAESEELKMALKATGYANAKNVRSAYDAAEMPASFVEPLDKMESIAREIARESDDPDVFEGFKPPERATQEERARALSLVKPSELINWMVEHAEGLHTKDLMAVPGCVTADKVHPTLPESVLYREEVNHAGSVRLRFLFADCMLELIVSMDGADTGCRTHTMLGGDALAESLCSALEAAVLETCPEMLEAALFELTLACAYDPER